MWRGCWYSYDRSCDLAVWVERNLLVGGNGGDPPIPFERDIYILDQPKSVKFLRVGGFGFRP
jgi:hypothetical protein